MKLHRGRAVVEKDEIATFAPLWIAISSEDDAFSDQRRDLAEKLLSADEAGLMKGTEPLLGELKPFAESIENRAKLHRPDMTETDLIHFTFFVFRVDEIEIERARNSQA